MLDTYDAAVLTVCSLCYIHISPSQHHCASVYRQTSFQQTSYRCISELHPQFVVKTRGAAAVRDVLVVLEMKQEHHALPIQGGQMADICTETPSVAVSTLHSHTILSFMTNANNQRLSWTKSHFTFWLSISQKPKTETKLNLMAYFWS